MNHCVMQQNAFAACEEMRGAYALAAAAERKHPTVFCPKPRRLSPLAGDPFLPLRLSARHQMDTHDSRAGSEILDIFLSKGGEHNQMASSPPFFCGSPPSRAANPIVHDEQFGEARPLVPINLPLAHSSSGAPPSPRKGCARTKFSLAPAAVLIEGFDCLNRDRRSSVAAVA